MKNDFCFGGIKVDSKKQVLKLRPIDTPVLVDRSNVVSSTDYVVTILSDEFYTPDQLFQIEAFLRKNKLTKYIILCPIKYRITRDEITGDQKDGIISFYKKNTSDFRKYIPSGSPIITSGPAIYSLLQEDDIYPKDVQQRLFGMPHFWFSYDLTSNGNWVYPIESFRELFAAGLNKPAVDSYKSQLAILQIRDVLKEKKPTPRYPKLNKIFIESKEDFYERFYEPNKDRKGELLAWDLETDGFDFLHGRIGCISLSFDGITGYYIPWEYVDKEKLGEILNKHVQTGSNLKFDCKWLWHQGIPTARIDEDVYILGHTLDETRFNSLKSLAYYYSEYGGYERALDIYREKYGVDSYLDIDEDILKNYAIMDAIVTRRVISNMLKHLEYLDKKYPNEKYPEDTLSNYYHYRRIPAANMYAHLEYEGVYVNKDKLDALRKVMQKAIDDLTLELCKDFDVPKSFNFGSVVKLGKLLQIRGWEDLGRTEAGGYQVSDYQLERWKKTHPEAAKIQKLNSFTTLISTFVGDEAGTKGWSQYLVHHDEDPPHVWRMHPDFIAMGTDSGRTRCKNPNMQNVPTRGQFTKEIKSCLCTPDDENYYMVTVDFSALQLRLATIDSGDENLTKVFTSKNADAHSMTAYLIFAAEKELDVEIIEVEDENGVKHTFLGGEKIETKRGEILAKDLREDDELV